MSPKHGHFGAMWPPCTVTPDKSAITDENFHSRNRSPKVPGERVPRVATGAEAGDRQLVAAALRAPLGCGRTRVAGRAVDGR